VASVINAAETETSQDLCMIFALTRRHPPRAAGDWWPQTSSLGVEISPKTGDGEGGPVRLFEQGKIDDVEPAEKAVNDGP
jgi:hypothetical protein